MVFSDQYMRAFLASVCCCLLIMMCESKITPGERNKIVNLHNVFRASVTPSASNMEKMVWNEELALLAEGFAAKCVADHQTDRNPRSPSFESIGRNFYVLSDSDLEKKLNYSTIVGMWFSESSNYNYRENICFGSSCGNYTQMVSATSNQLGCGTFYCEQPVQPIGLNGRFLVCNYAPGENLEEERWPYKLGVPCSNCPSGTTCDPDSDLCSLQVVETPHFRVTLPSGHMFCYNIQGQKDAVYNLISSKHFEMNAGFSTDALNSSDSWMDSIGVTVFHKGQETTLIKFSASAWEVNIGESVSLEADQVDKITVSKGRLMILPMYPKEFPDISPSIEVYFSDLDLDFSVHYMESIYEDHKRAQVSLYWRSTGAIHSGAHGIVGQLLQEGVHISETEKKLIIPEHAPVSVTEIPALKLPEDSSSQEHNGRRCWSTANRIIQRDDVIKGTSVDYMVDDVFSTGFKFGGL